MASLSELGWHSRILCQGHVLDDGISTKAITMRHPNVVRKTVGADPLERQAALFAPHLVVLMSKNNELCSKISARRPTSVGDRRLIQIFHMLKEIWGTDNGKR